MAQSTEKDVGVFGKSSPLNFDWAYFATFIVGLLFLYWFVFLIAVWLKGYFTDIKLERWFNGKMGFGGYIMGAFTGAVTPFCSCTTVPIFAGMVDNNIKHGYAISFLIASPTINPPALILFYALFGGQLTLTYAAVCFTIAVIGGMILGNERFKSSLIEIFMVNEDEGFRLSEVNRQYMGFLKTLAPVIVIAAAIATGLKGWQPSDAFLGYTSGSTFAIPLSVLSGGILYADIAMLLPIGQLFLDKGLDVGLVFSFMMAASGVGLPSVLLLTRIFKKDLLSYYLLTIFTLFTTAGFFISWIL